MARSGMLWGPGCSVALEGRYCQVNSRALYRSLRLGERSHRSRWSRRDGRDGGVDQADRTERKSVAWRSWGSVQFQMLLSGRNQRCGESHHVKYGRGRFCEREVNTDREAHVKVVRPSKQITQGKASGSAMTNWAPPRGTWKHVGG